MKGGGKRPDAQPTNTKRPNAQSANAVNGNPFTFKLTPAAFWRWGRVALAGALVFMLALVLMLAWKAPMGLLTVPVLLLAGVAVWWLVQRPLVHLCVVLGGFSVVAGFGEGFQVREVLYGLYYLSFLAIWFITRLFVYRDPIFEDSADWAMAFFLCWVSVSFGLTLLFGGSVQGAISEWIAFSMLAFYFPVKEACKSYRRGTEAMIGVLLGLGVFVAVRNLISFQSLLQSAEMVWQIMHGRVITNEILLLVPALIALTGFLHVKKRSHRYVLLAGFLLFFTSLILTQSRAYWIDFGFGFVVLFVLVERWRKYRLLAWSTASFLGLIGITFVFFENLFYLLASGLIDRFLSIGSAASKDISLVNRFYEWNAVWTAIKKNPIVGYGMGVPYSVFDIVSGETITKPFSHNGFLMIWYKFGLIGLVALVFVWGRGLWVGIRTLWQQRVAGRWRLYGLMMVVSLAAMLPSANTSLPFYTSDTGLAFTIVVGVSMGLHWRKSKAV